MLFFSIPFWPQLRGDQTSLLPQLEKSPEIASPLEQPLSFYRKLQQSVLLSIQMKYKEHTKSADFQHYGIHKKEVYQINMNPFNHVVIRDGCIKGLYALTETSLQWTTLSSLMLFLTLLAFFLRWIYLTKLIIRCEVLVWNICVDTYVGVCISINKS